MTKILFIPVAYHSDADTLAFVDAVLALQEANKAAVWIADNTPNTGTSAIDVRVQAINQKNIKYLSFNNLGYFGAAHETLVEYQKTNPLPHWTIVCNVDVAFTDDAFLKTLLTQQPWGVIAPKIISTRFGQNQNPNMQSRPAATRMRFYAWLFQHYYLTIGYEMVSFLKLQIGKLFRKNTEKPPADVAREIYAPHGSFMVFHRSFFEKGGTLQYPSFLFGEEVFVAETAQKTRSKVVYQPDLQVFHTEHATTGSVFRSRKVIGFTAASAKYLYEAFFS